VTITGAGTDQTLIEWAAAVPDSDPLTGDRIFHVQIAAGASANIASVVIQDLAVRNGEVGLIPTAASGTGDLDPVNDTNAYDIEVVNSTAGSIAIWQFRRMGGAIALGAGYAVVLYEETTHGAGGAPVGGGGQGGPFPGGKPGEEAGFTIDNVTLNRVAVVGSWSGADGGGVYSAVPSTIATSIVSGNTSNANGGGIYNDAVMSMTDTTVGKLFDAAAPAELTQPNTAENGGGLFDTGSHTTTIAGSAINGNSAIGGGAIAGRAGITIDMDNSTVSGNSATDVGGGITTNGTVNLRNVTVMDNVATTDAPGGGAGLNAFGPGVFNIVNTVLQNNRKVPLPPALPELVNCGCSGGGACAAGIMVSAGSNLEDGDTCDLDVATLQDQINADALLGVLQDNGGLTETHAIGSGSPVIDAGDDAVCLTLVGLYGDVDQRGTGFPRRTDGNGDRVTACDIGAVEAPAVGGGGGGGGGGCVAAAGRGYDPMFLLFLAAAAGYRLLRRRTLGWR
ncbi:MAG: choice-of-anchor Q domain-containing protein, partial [Pseudomonadota bacterium]